MILDRLRTNKYFRCFAFERNMQVLGAILLILFICVGLEFFTMWGQHKELARLKEEHATLVRKINKKKAQPVPESEGQPTTDQLDEAFQKTKKLVIKGIIRNNDSLSVMINKYLYNVGDTLGDYTIIDITEDSATLRNETTRGIRKLYFYNDM